MPIAPYEICVYEQPTADTDKHFTGSISLFYDQ
jgi:hypothetical protein